MDIISGLPNELLVKILSFLLTKEVVSTSILSKRWESLWLWIPKLEFVVYRRKSYPLRDFITKNLSLLKPPVLENFCLQCSASSFQPEDIKHWIGTAVSRCVCELKINYQDYSYEHKSIVLPSSLYTCKSLVTLKFNGYKIIVDVPRTVDLPSLKTLELGRVTYSKEDSLQLLLPYCPVLEDLVIERLGDDNVKTIVVINPSVRMLSLPIDGGRDYDVYVIVTPSLKYFKVMCLYIEDFSYLKMHMPKLEEADLFVEENVERLFESITFVKRLSLSVLNICKDESMYRSGIVFNQLEHLKIEINRDYWSKLLVRLLEDSPKLRVLKIHADIDSKFEEYELASWNNDDESSVPKCLVESLETFEFERYTGGQEERDFVSYILKNAPHVKSSSIKH